MPTIASIAPACISSPVTWPTSSASSDESITRRRSWRSSRPPAALISACASCAQAIDDGPQMPAEPLIGTSRPTTNSFVVDDRASPPEREPARRASDGETLDAATHADRRLLHGDHTPRGAAPVVGLERSALCFLQESDFYNITAMSASEPHLALLLERASRVVGDRLSRDDRPRRRHRRSLARAAPSRRRDRATRWARSPSGWR